MRNKNAFMAIALGLVLTTAGSGATYAYFSSQIVQSNTVRMSVFKKFKIDFTVNSTKAVESVNGKFASYTTENTDNNLGGMKFKIKAETENGKESLGNDIKIVFGANWDKKNTATWNPSTKTIYAYLQPSLLYYESGIENLINKASIPDIKKIDFDKIGGLSGIALSTSDTCSATLSGGINTVKATKESTMLTISKAPEIDGSFDINFKNNNNINITKTIKVSTSDSAKSILNKVKDNLLSVDTINKSYDIKVNSNTITITNKNAGKNTDIDINLLVK
ncbi:hypothetical protein SAMN02745196_02779 [Clostridium collagenovorans DSM 3089]|uniref:Uncharacterized protein n=2 Tax=Clostridium TaxID=1485 RepID=A0A1M5YAP2_9CLOT|nr:hypothetical protein SAMN02745196_02779 [Clostridium collagenovorans DSM 3089]